MPAAKPKVPRQCKQCSKITYVNPCHANRPFCNRECMAAYYSEHPHAPKGRPGLRGPDSPRWKGGPIETVCANCGKPVFRKPDQFKRAKNHFCNPRCRGEWARKTGAQAGENNNGWKGGSFDTQCANCGKPLKRCGYKMKRSEYHFCSKDCHGEWDAQHNTGENSTNWRGGPVSDPCAWCGVSIERPRAWAERNGKRRLAFCCDACHSEYQSKNFSGPDNPNWKGGYEPYYGPNWPRQRCRARKRDDYTCQRCETTEAELGQQLDVHHIRPFRLFLREHDNDAVAASKIANRLHNLACYCRRCHMLVENHGE